MHEVPKPFCTKRSSLGSSAVALPILRPWLRPLHDVACRLLIHKRAVLAERRLGGGTVDVTDCSGTQTTSNRSSSPPNHAQPGSSGWISFPRQTISPSRSFDPIDQVLRRKSDGDCRGTGSGTERRWKLAPCEETRRGNEELGPD
jgi:hypothetical protein